MDSSDEQIYVPTFGYSGVLSRTTISDLVSNSVYSLHEVIIGIWVDGKTIYRKVFNINVDDLHNGIYDTNNNNNDVIYHFLNIERYIRVDVICIDLNSDIPTCFPLSVFSVDAGTNSIPGTGKLNNGLNYNNDEITISNGIADNFYPNFYLILEYTKID